MRVTELDMCIGSTYGKWSDRFGGTESLLLKSAVSRAPDKGG
jgi:hypothetical protein